jgi:hypothetical protein
MTNKQAEDFLKEYYANKSNPILWTIKQNTGWSIDEVAEILNEYASQQPSIRWVKASERLPKEEGDYFMCDPADGDMFVSHFTKGGFHYVHGEMISKRNLGFYEWLEESPSTPSEEEWISVDERLPSLGSTVMTFPHFRVLPFGNSESELNNDATDTNFWDWHGDDETGSPMVIKNVQYWMPLPDVPKQFLEKVNK